MKVSNLIKDSNIGIIGYADKTHLEKLQFYINHNKWLYNQFQYIYVCYTCDDIKYFNEVYKIWRNNFNNCYINLINPNLGHTFGTMLLDNIVIGISQKHSSKKYTWKSTVDILIYPELLEIDIEEKDWYGVTTCGFGGMEQYNYNYDNIIKNDFYPFTNFYIINNKVDYINNIDLINKKYELYKNNTNLHPWELINSSETLLKECLERNKFTKQLLLSDNNYKKLLEFIYNYKIHDPSIKNILLKDLGICHYHIFNNNIHLIS